MDTTILGRTGLEVSVAGLGCGGHSRLGMARGESEAHASSIVEHALSLGINFIDTARAYGTEAAVGNAIRGKRDKVVISTKSSAGRGGKLLTGDEVVESLERSLTRLRTDYIDVFNLHGVSLDQYDWVVKEILPALGRAREAGKIRFLGATEGFGSDPSHKMFQRALPDDHFDVIMVGFNLLNPSARKAVFPLTMAHNVATQIMFAVRRALSQPSVLAEVVEQLIERGEVDAGLVDRANPLGFVAAHPDVGSVVEAAYRYCRHEPGATVVLTGTGHADHLTENVASILKGPLPPEILAKLDEIFGKVDSVSGN
ncbi:MAG: aldo/keto reductase [Pseudomonadales bacterium]|nr:aldo/keto reductase [Pseudomonadales bacterium]